ncbi:PilZ domain-containing protein [Marinobacter sp. F4206]|uniref:PilZ domain-containing protein n=1 Tax=Marinobacter sp. F4206 TaxID=2861777 RepID=UPI001C6059DE|nr:PilZ domain-containing protein [Marinobacter sp. F4206]MBW4933307.1 PilZ domain-containing protein [Marinobacter sp. F4206]
MSDADYDFGRPDREVDGPDNRTDYRLTATARATLELESEMPEPGSDRQRRELVCRIRDISARGLCLFSKEPISLGALLPALVSLGRHPEPFTLIVEVVWCRPHQTEFLVGVQIQESDDTAYVEWLEAVAAAMAED